MILSSDNCYEALRARDSRFDGVFFVGVSTTGIYCRPVCRVRLPGRDRCSYYFSAAAAEAEGYRPCLRCRPELAPGNAPQDAAEFLGGRIVARIEAGALDVAGVEELAAEFAISSRQLRRVVVQEYGVSPVQLAQTRRLLMAKQLLTDTRMPVYDVARVSGFSSMRRFNHLFRSRYRLSPSDLRRRADGDVDVDAANSQIVLTLGYRPPLEWQHLLAFLAGRGATCTEMVADDEYLKTVRIGEHRGWIAARADLRRCVVRVRVSGSLLPVLSQLRGVLRQLFDLDANPAVIAAHLQMDERLGACCDAAPGLRVPGTTDAFELVLRAIIGQQISVRAATTIFNRVTERFGEEIETPFEGLDRLAPTADAIAGASVEQLVGCGLTGRRAETIRAVAAAVACDDVDLQQGSDAQAALDGLQRIAGIGPWTCQYIAMRAMRDLDAFPDSDLALLKAMGCSRPKQLAAGAEGWRPWRAYAAMHLWHELSSGG